MTRVAVGLESTCKTDTLHTYTKWQERRTGSNLVSGSRGSVRERQTRSPGSEGGKERGRGGGGKVTVAPCQLCLIVGRHHHLLVCANIKAMPTPLSLQYCLYI